MKKLCKACFEDKDLLEAEEYCPECKKIVEEDKTLIQKLPPDHWSKDGQIDFISGKGYTINAEGKIFCLGKEEEILEILETKEIPEKINAENREFYEHTFELMEEEKNGTEEPRTARRVKTSHRAPKSTKRSYKRIRRRHYSDHSLNRGEKNGGSRDRRNRSPGYRYSTRRDRNRAGD